MRSLTVWVLTVFLLGCTQSSNKKTSLSLNFKSSPLGVSKVSTAQTLEAIQLIVMNKNTKAEIHRKSYQASEVLGSDGDYNINLEFDQGIDVFVAVLLEILSEGSSEPQVYLAFNSEAKNLSGSASSVELDKYILLDPKQNPEAEYVKVVGRYVPQTGLAPSGVMKGYLRPFVDFPGKGFELDDSHMFSGTFEVGLVQYEGFEFTFEIGDLVITSADIKEQVEADTESAMSIAIPAHYENKDGVAEFGPGAKIVAGFFGPGVSAEKVRYLGTSADADGSNGDIFLNADLTSPLGWRPDPGAADANSHIHREIGGTSDLFAACFTDSETVKDSLLSDNMCFHLGNMEKYMSGVAGMRGPFKLYGVGNGNMASIQVSNAEPPVVSWSYVDGDVAPENVSGVRVFYNLDFDRADYAKFVSGGENFVDCSLLASDSSLGFTALPDVTGTEVSLPAGEMATGDVISLIACPFSGDSSNPSFFPQALLHEITDDGSGGGGNYDGYQLALPKKMLKDVCYHGGLLRQQDRNSGDVSFVSTSDYHFYQSLSSCQASPESGESWTKTFSSSQYLEKFYFMPKSTGSKTVKIVRSSDHTSTDQASLLDISVKEVALPSISRFDLVYEASPVVNQCYPVVIYATDADGFAVPASNTGGSITAYKSNGTTPVAVLVSSAGDNPCGGAFNSSLSLGVASETPNFFGFMRIDPSAALNAPIKLKPNFGHNTSVQLTDITNSSLSPIYDVNPVPPQILVLDMGSPATESTGEFSFTATDCVPISLKLENGFDTLTPALKKYDNIRIEFHDGSAADSPRFGVYEASDCSGENKMFEEHGRSTFSLLSIEKDASVSQTLYLKAPNSASSGDIDIYGEFPLLEFGTQNPRFNVGD